MPSPNGCSPTISTSLSIGHGDSQPPRNMIDASAAIRIMFMYSARKNSGERDARVLDVEAGDDLRLAFGHVERMAVGLGDARHEVDDEQRKQRPDVPVRGAALLPADDVATG